jgi:hypothetical protein
MTFQWWDDGSARALRALRSGMIVAVTLAAMACSDDPAGPADEPDPDPTAADSAAGTFALSAVNTSAIPATILSESGYVLQVTASTATLSANGELRIALNTREVVAGFASEYADTLRGTWTQNGATVRFTIAPASESVLVGWDGTRITLGLIVATAEGDYVFSKD